MWQRTSLYLIARPYNTEKLRLLTYTQALTKPNTTLPYLSQHQENNESELINTLSNIYTAAKSRNDSGTRHDTNDLYNHLSCSANGLEAESYRNNNTDEESSSSPCTALQTRRWVRDADELCVAEMRRSTNINKLNTYIATYKLDHPHWEPLLLPEVHLVPSSPALATTRERRERSDKNDATHVSSHYEECHDESSSREHDHQHNNNNNNNNNHYIDNCNGTCASYDVYIDYNKLTSLELMSRHANFALRHIVQKGHAMYFITHSQHSILAMRGVVEASHVTTAYGVNPECLRTYITHVGPLDVRQVIEIDPVTHHVSFNFNKPNIARGVVALSQVEGYGTWFERRTMLWQRTRRVGAMQGGLGALDYTLANPLHVGKLREFEVSLLEPHMQLFKNNGSFSGGAAHATGLIASTQVTQNAKFYLGQFEAPAFVVLDAIQQLSHYSALDHKLIHNPPRREWVADATAMPFHKVTSPPPPSTTTITSSTQSSPEPGRELLYEEEELEEENGNRNTTSIPVSLKDNANCNKHEKVGKQEERESNKSYLSYKEFSELTDVRQRLEAEKLLPVSWLSRSPPPYIPAEVDLPFKIQLSRPTVFPCEHAPEHSQEQKETTLMEDNNNNDEVRCFPTGTAVGSPYIVNVPLTLFEFNIHQGASHYLYDESPSSRPLKWWSQRNNVPYNGYMYFMRSQLIDDARAAEQIDNPIALNESNHKVRTKLKRRSKSKLTRQQCKQINTKECKTNATSSNQSTPKEPTELHLQNVTTSNNTDCDDERRCARHCEQWVSSHKELVGFIERDDDDNININKRRNDKIEHTTSEMREIHEEKMTRMNSMTNDSSRDDIDQVYESEENERLPFHDIIKASARACKRARLYKNMINSAQANASKKRKQREKTPKNAERERIRSEQDTKVFADIADSNDTSCNIDNQRHHRVVKKMNCASDNARRVAKTHSLSQLRRALAVHSHTK